MSNKNEMMAHLNAHDVDPSVNGDKDDDASKVYKH